MSVHKVTGIYFSYFYFSILLALLLFIVLPSPLTHFSQFLLEYPAMPLTNLFLPSMSSKWGHFSIDFNLEKKKNSKESSLESTEAGREQ